MRLVDGAVIQELGDNKTYLIVGGAKVLIPSLEVYERYGNPPTEEIPAGVYFRLALGGITALAWQVAPRPARAQARVPAMRQTAPMTTRLSARS